MGPKGSGRGREVGGEGKRLKSVGVERADDAETVVAPEWMDEA